MWFADDELGSGQDKNMTIGICLSERDNGNGGYEQIKYGKIITMATKIVKYSYSQHVLP